MLQTEHRIEENKDERFPSLRVPLINLHDSIPGILGILPDRMVATNRVYNAAIRVKPTTSLTPDESFKFLEQKSRLVTRSRLNG